MAVAVKICGIRNEEDATAAFQLGADYVGLVFWPFSSRVVSPSQAATIVRRAPGTYVAVCKDVTASELLFILETVPVNAAQLHGSVPDGWIQAVHRRGMLAISTRAEEEAADIWLLDGPVAGSGNPWSWRLPPRGKRKLWLAGGLNPDNVGGLVRQWAPDGVDVSSGVEVNGEKNRELIARFIKEAKIWQP